MKKRTYIGEPVIELFYSVIYFVLDEKTIFEIFYPWPNLMAQLVPWSVVHDLGDPIKIHGPCPQPLVHSIKWSIVDSMFGPFIHVLQNKTVIFC